MKQALKMLIALALEERVILFWLQILLMICAF